MSEFQKIESGRDKLVTKSNVLIEANYKLGVVEQKIILCLASNIHPTDSDFKTYTLPIKEFSKLLGLKGSPKYTELKQITKDLMQKVFEVRIGKKVIQVTWLSYVAYNESAGTIDLRFDPFLRPYLLELKREFTSYKLENIVSLKSSYAIRIYELLKQYEKIQERIFSISELRQKLGAEDIYPAYGNFKQRVLLPAQRELKKKTDISFQFEETKIGRRVGKVKFTIQPVKKNTDKQLKLFEENLEEFKFPNSFSGRVKKLGLMMGVRIPDETINHWGKFGQDHVISLMEKIQEKKDIENPIGYVTTILKSIKNNTEPQVNAKSESKTVLPYLISHFRKSKEKMPDWFITEKAVEELQSHFKMDFDEANSMFKKIEKELFEILGVTVHKSDSLSKEELEQKRIELKEILNKLRKKV